ncbi:methyltransferase-like protein 27 [Lytechinus variegatus]|uniref:methyltransferase-like protein 27 n=1 Tax=Lytechinus variegatus TaxID=7654 RepID=UPI001BB1A99E|nr:methyltransferase-like protein 27 [Lytechinus variegatus]
MAIEMPIDKIAEAFTIGIEQGPKELEDYYDKWAVDKSAENYDQVLKEAGYVGPAAVASILNRLVQDKTKKILDVGCGTGMVGEELAKLGFSNVSGVDPSQESLNACKTKGVYKELIHSYVGPVQLEIEENSFDGAVSSGTFLPGHCDGTSLKEVVRLVKPGGAIVIATRKTWYMEKPGEWNYAKWSPVPNHPKEFNFRAASDELVSAKKCTLVYEEIPSYAEGEMGIGLVYTVL